MILTGYAGALLLGLLHLPIWKFMFSLCSESLPSTVTFFMLFRNRTAHASEAQGERLLRSAHNEKVDS